jgi:hypothetical protein
MRVEMGALPWQPSHKACKGTRAGNFIQQRSGRYPCRPSRLSPSSVPAVTFFCHILRPYDEGAADGMSELADTFDAAFSKAVDLGNRIADKDKDADLWDIADGLLAGAIQYWLYSRQPCGDPRCQDCMPISTAQGRMAELNRLIEQLASESEYFHTPTDANAGRA